MLSRDKAELQRRPAKVTANQRQHSRQTWESSPLRAPSRWDPSRLPPATRPRPAGRSLCALMVLTLRLPTPTSRMCQGTQVPSPFQSWLFREGSSALTEADGRAPLASSKMNDGVEDRDMGTVRPSPCPGLHPRLVLYL